MLSLRHTLSRTLDAGNRENGEAPLTLDAARSDASRARALVVDGGGSRFDGSAPPNDDAAIRGSSDEVVVEAAFDRDTEPWEGEPGVTLAWQDQDARGAAASGSASVSNESGGSGGTWVFGTVERCAPAVGSTVYALNGSAFIPTGQGAGGAGLGISFFSEENCAGATDDSYDTPPTDKSGAWTIVSGETASPPDAKSLRIRLVVPKPLSAPSFEANFDDVRVTRR